MKTLAIKTKGNTDIINLTGLVQEELSKSGVGDGLVNLFVIGSTAGLTTIEYEPNLKNDFKEFFERIIPEGNYNHNKIWNDDNGHSHIRASLLKPELNIPFKDKKLLLGSWQQIVLVDFDTSPRKREIVVTTLKSY